MLSTPSPSAARQKNSYEPKAISCGSRLGTTSRAPAESRISRCTWRTRPRIKRAEVLVRGNSYVLGVQRVAQTRLSCLVLGPKTTARIRLDEPNYTTTEGYLATQLDEAWMGVQRTRIRMSAGDRAAAVEAFTWRNGCIERSKPDGLRKANCARSNWDASSQGRLTALIHKAIPKNGAIESTQVSKVRPRLCF